MTVLRAGYCDDVPDTMTLGKPRTHQATKRFACHACAHFIEPGQSYEAQAWLEDGEFRFSRRHNDVYQCWRKPYWRSDDDQ